MKKVILLTLSLAASITFISCTSKEEKVQELIKNEMFRTLYDFESYQPIETKIDSAFNSVYDNVTVLAYASLMNDNRKEYIKLNDKMDEDMDIIETYGRSNSSYLRMKYEQALEHFSENLMLAKATNSQNIDYEKSIKEISDTLNLGFIGWKATHRFRSKNKGGNFDIGTHEYIINSSFDSIIKSKDLNDELIERLKWWIDNAIKEKDSLQL